MYAEQRDFEKWWVSKTQKFSLKPGFVLAFISAKWNVCSL